MADDWQVGDLALSVTDEPLCGLCAPYGEPNVGKYAKVVGVLPHPLGVPDLLLTIDPSPLCSCNWIKVEKDKHEPCEEEFVTLIKREQVRAMTYDWRTTPCECDGGTTYAIDRDGYYDQRCEICEGVGTVTASCCECAVVEPLNADGECEKCADSATLSLEAFMAKYHPHVFIERRAA